MHLGSEDICLRLGDCLPSNEPPAIYAADAVRALDDALVSRGVVFSSGYLYGLDELELDSATVARQTRLENEFTAAEVAKHRSRLIGFLSVDPLEASAIEEIRHWRGSRELVGLKLHFAASGVDMGNEVHRVRLGEVLQAAAGQRMPVAMHIGGGDFDAKDAETFIRDVLPHATPSWVQIAHAGGGYPFTGDRHVRVLQVFGDFVAADDPRTRRTLFGLAYVPAPEQDAEAVSELLHAMRRIGIGRFLFGSDFNVLTPAQQIEALDRFGLTPKERDTLRASCGPWARSGR